MSAWFFSAVAFPVCVVSSLKELQSLYSVGADQLGITALYFFIIVLVAFCSNFKWRYSVAVVTPNIVEEKPCGERKRFPMSKNTRGANN